jgi:hypothetical protein
MMPQVDGAVPPSHQGALKRKSNASCAEEQASCSSPPKAQKVDAGIGPLHAHPAMLEPAADVDAGLRAFLSPQTSVLALLSSTASNHASVAQWTALHEREAQAVPLVLTNSLHAKFNASARGAVVFAMFTAAATLAEADKARMHTATRELLHRAVQLMDRFIGCTTSDQDFPLGGLQAKNGMCVGLAAMSLAWKFDKCNSIDVVKALCRAAYGVRSDNDDIVSVAGFERTIWEKFDFDVSSVSSCEFIHGYLFLIAQHLVQRFDALPPSASAERQRVGRQLQALLSTRAYLQAMYLADVALFHVSVWMHYPSVFAAALLLYVQSYLRPTPVSAEAVEAEQMLRNDIHVTLQAVTGYSADALTQPLVHIEACHHVIDACPNSPLYAFFKNRDANSQTTNGCAEIRFRLAPYASGLDGHLERIRFLERFTCVSRTNQPARFPQQYDTPQFRASASALYQPVARVLPPVLHSASEQAALQVCRLARDFLHIVNPPPVSTPATMMSGTAVPGGAQP